MKTKSVVYSIRVKEENISKIEAARKLRNQGKGDKVTLEYLLIKGAEVVLAASLKS